jgi:hypothetical protein
VKAEAHQDARELDHEPRERDAHHQPDQTLAAPRLIDARGGKEHDDEQAVEQDRRALQVVEPDAAAVQRGGEQRSCHDHRDIDDSRQHAQHVSFLFEQAFAEPLLVRPVPHFRFKRCMTLLKRQENPLSSAQVFRKIIGNSCRAIRELIRQLFPNRRCRGNFMELYGSARSFTGSGCWPHRRNIFYFLFTSDE